VLLSTTKKRIGSCCTAKDTRKEGTLFYDYLNELRALQMVRNKLQTVSAAQDWRDRMRAARERLPEGVGQQPVMEYVVGEAPHLDRLTLASRWRNAWLSRVADPEITQLVEKAADHFEDKEQTARKRLRRQKLVRPT
jgi:hypothetical protein